eukprot:scaffold178440_cov17-Prasinocladus_malaysianus.AAC.1
MAFDRSAQSNQFILGVKGGASRADIPRRPWPRRNCPILACCQAECISYSFARQLTNQQISESLNEPINRPVNQPLSQPVSQPTSLRFKQSVVHCALWYIQLDPAYLPVNPVLTNNFSIKAANVGTCYTHFMAWRQIVVLVPKQIAAMHHNVSCKRTHPINDVNAAAIAY